MTGVDEIAGAEAEVLCRVLGRLAQGDVDGAVALMSADVTMRIPFEIPGMPAELRGRDEIRAFMSRINSIFETPFRLELTAWYPLAGGDGATAEYECEARVRGRSTSYRNTYVGIFAFRDGQITGWKEYPNPLPILELQK